MNARRGSVHSVTTVVVAVIALAAIAATGLLYQNRMELIQTLDARTSALELEKLDGQEKAEELDSARKEFVELDAMLGYLQSTDKEAEGGSEIESQVHTERIIMGEHMLAVARKLGGTDKNEIKNARDLLNKLGWELEASQAKVAELEINVENKDRKIESEMKFRTEMKFDYETRISQIMEEKSRQAEVLTAKIEELDATINKLREELAAAKEAKEGGGSGEDSGEGGEGK